MRTPAALLAAVLLVAAPTACSSSGGKNTPGGSSSPAESKHAAEPATAPATSAAPAGTTEQVGDTPEGIVYDPKTRLLAVAVRAPDRLLLLDPTTLAVRRSVPLPGDVRHLQVGYGGGSVLVPAESAAEILQVTLPGGATVATKVLRQPHDAAEASNGDVVVGNEFGKSISIVRDGTVIKTVADLTQPGGVIADGTTVGVVDVGAYTLSTYDLTTLTRTGRIAAGKGPTHGVLISGNRMLVTDTRGNAILIDSVSPLKQVTSFSLPGTPYGVSVDSTTGLVWVTLTALNQVVGLDVSGSTPKIVARYDTVQQPNTVAVAPGSHELWITGTKDGVVQRITR